MQRRLTHQICAHSGELALRQLRKFLIQRQGDHAIENAVANKLQAFVVRRAEATMRERLAQQTRFAKGVPEGGFQTQS